MNWLQKTSQKPMPHVVPKPPGDVPKGYREIDDIMTQETADREMSEYPEIAYLGAGKIGTATRIAPGVVLKYTPHFTEYVTAQDQYKYKVPFLVQVLEEPKKVQDFPDIEIYGIVTEEITPLTEDEKIIFDYIGGFKIMRLPAGQEMTLKDALTINRHREKHVKPYYPEKYSYIHPRLIEKVFNGYKWMFDSFKKANFYSSDAHKENVGWTDDGRLVLFDLGGSSFG